MDSWLEEDDVLDYLAVHGQASVRVSEWSGYPPVRDVLLALAFAADGTPSDPHVQVYRDRSGAWEAALQLERGFVPFGDVPMAVAEWRRLVSGNN